MRSFKSASKELASASLPAGRPSASAANFNGIYNHHSSRDLSAHSLSKIAEVLEGTGDYRVLRRVVPREELARLPAGETTMIGIVLDVETTGLNTRTDEIIELGMTKFAFTKGGLVARVIDTFCEFNEPTVSIPKFVTALTGISDDMVAGHHIDPVKAASFLSDASLVIAHNAKFDRPFVERYWPEFEHVAWACSAQINWRALGFAGARLTELLGHIGLFHDAHRATDDCQALLEVLAFKLPGAETTILSLLLDEARRQTVRIWAQNAPYHLKDILKQRRYRWNDGSDGRPRSWFVDVDESLESDEVKFLREQIYCSHDADFHIQRLSAFLRFSNRI